MNLKKYPLSDIIFILLVGKFIFLGERYEKNFIFRAVI